MKFAGRINSLAFQDKESVFEVIDRYKKVPDITHLEFNCPEHISRGNMEAIRDRINGEMAVNGVATRFKAPFAGGEFTNKDSAVRKAAVDICKEAIDTCRCIGGNVVTVWQAFDGFDYPFQVDYEKAWTRQIDAFREVCDYAGDDVRISIEYKPFEPRSYAFMDSVGMVLYAISEIDRPNIGMTLDFCHMLMKHDCPANALALAGMKDRLYGLHMNDGHGFMDNGLIFGTINAAQALEFVYYLHRYSYEGVVFFDSFPVRENAIEEIGSNIAMYKALDKAVLTVGMERIGKVLAQQDGCESQRLILELLRNM